MNLVLEMKVGPIPGKKLVVAEGEELVLGRAASVDFSFPADQFLSGRHCSLSAAPQGCRITDLGSSNGTFVNGSRVKEALLKQGDQIGAGHLTLLVHLTETLQAAPSRADASPAASPSKRAESSVSAVSPVRIGMWSFRSLPKGWEVIEGHGIRDANKDAFPSSVIVGQDALRDPLTLEQYIKNQLIVIRANMPEARPKEAVPAVFSSAREAALLEIELPAPDGRPGVLRQFYARFGDRVGVVTFTTLASELPRLQPVFDSIRSDLMFSAE